MRRSALVALAIALGLAGCRSKISTDVTPPAVSAPAVPADLALPTLYDGDLRFLPLGLHVVAGADTPFEYDYDVTYVRDDPHYLLVMFNPLRWFGYPIGKTTVTAVGTLFAREAGLVVKKYEAKAVVVYERTMYASDSQTALRAGALRVVCKSIEAQMGADLPYLRSVASRARSEPPSEAVLE